MKALWVFTTRFAKNGSTAVAMNYFAALPQGRCRIDFVTPNPLPAEALAQLEAQGGRSFVLPMRNRNPLGYLGQLTRIVRAGRYDVVHAHGNSCTLAVEMLAAKLGGAPVRIAHSHNTGCTHTRLHRLLRRPFERAVTCRVACGQAAGEWLFQDKPFTVLNNAVDPARFAFSAESRARARASLGWQDAFIVGHVGTFSPRKNHAFLAEAFLVLAAKRPDARLLLVGEGETMEAVRAAFSAAGAGDRACFFGETDGIAPLLSAMDAFALPSLAEGLPVTLIEAQAAGLPCLAADTVTPECDVAGLVTLLPLSLGAAGWAARLNAVETGDRAAACRAAREAIRAKGYDIRENGVKLMELYEAETGKRV